MQFALCGNLCNIMIKNLFLNTDLGHSQTDTFGIKSVIRIIHSSVLIGGPLIVTRSPLTVKYFYGIGLIYIAVHVVT